MFNPLRHFVGPKPSHGSVFAFQVLPELLATGQQTLKHLASEDNLDFLHDTWNAIPKHHRIERDRSHLGLACNAHWLGGNHLLFLIQLPIPAASGDPILAAIATSPSLRYFTFDLSKTEHGENKSLLSERKHGLPPIALKELPAPTDNAALRQLCRTLKLDETIEAPLPVQLAPDPLTASILNSPILDACDAREADTLHSLALSASRNERSLPLALERYRELLAFLGDKLGPHLPESTTPYPEIAKILVRLHHPQEAEIVARDWWAICRRHRPVGHSETLEAIDSIALTLDAQKRKDEASILRDYREQLARLTLGNTSLRNEITDEIYAYAPNASGEELKST